MAFTSSLNGCGGGSDSPPPPPGLPNLSVADLTLTEGSASASQVFAVRLDRASSAQVTVHYTTTPGTAQAPDDFTLTEGILTFAPGTLVANVRVAIADDSLYEGNEAFAFVLSDATNASISRTAAIGLIIDDESPPTLAVQPASFAEGSAGNAQLWFELTLSAVSGVRGSVDYTTVPLTATEGIDYTATQGTAVFPPGTTTVSVHVPVVDDSIDEFDEQLQLQLTLPSEVVLARPFAVGTIVDDDPLPFLSIGDAASSESGGTLDFPVNLSTPSGKPVSVQYASSNASASAGADYVAASGTLDFQPGEVQKTIAIPIISDFLFEGQETFLVTLSDVAHATFGQAVAVGTILDNDSPPADPPAAVTITDVAVTEGDSGTVLGTFSVQLSEPESAAVSVDWATVAGTATAGADFVGASGTLTFPPGTTTRSIDIEVIGDTLNEDDETFRVALGNVTGNIVLADGTADAQITDDDALPELSITDANAVEGNAGGQALNLTVSLSAASGRTVSVSYASSGGSATAGSDFTAAAGNLSFDPGVTAQVIAVPILADVLYESDETFAVSLSDPAFALIANGLATVTIQNDDDPPAINVGDASVAEGNSGFVVLAFPLSLSSQSGLPATVAFATADLTATVGQDYVAASGTATFAPGQAATSVQVTVIGDVVIEADETLTLTLSNPLHATLANAIAEGTILDDDGQPLISMGDVSLVEGNSGMADLSFTVQLTDPGALPISVDFSTSNGTAIAGQDYAPASGTVNFAVGETAKSVSIQIYGDTLHELDETFTVALSNPVNAALAVTQAQGTIVNDDSPPLLSVADVTQIEGSGGPSTMSFTVQLTAASGLDVTVDYATSDGTATAGVDYTVTSGTLTIPAGATSAVIGVTISGDALDEVNESFSLTLSNPVNAEMSDGVAQGNITDDDAQPSFSINDATVTEGANGVVNLSFSISLSAASGRETRVSFASTSGTAQAGQDFTPVSGMLTFTPGQTAGQVAVPVLHDTLDEDDESMQVTLSAPQNASIFEGIGTGTIVDNDDPPSLTITDATVTEGDSGIVPLTFTVALSAASGKEISVSYATQDGSASAGDDYLGQSDVLIFNPGFASLEIAVDVLGDLQEEGNETLLVELSNAVNASIADASATGTITNDDSVVSWGLDSRPSNLTCVAPDRPAVDASIALVDAFPNVFVDRPIAMEQPPGDESVWFVIDQEGQVFRIAKDMGTYTKTLLIDITVEVDDTGGEMGLLGLAFHPDYATPGSGHEGELFLSYTVAGPKSRVSRFTSIDDWATWSQETIIEINQDFDNHNGGNVAFGPDGYLYIGYGDGGSFHDPFGRSQDTTNLLGDMLRLDVDGGTPYAIPPDNPFFGNMLCSADHSSVSSCPEIYAWGLRNPWRWSFDRDTGALWLGDVGQDNWEEIDLIELGGNYGWDIREGAHCHEPGAGCTTQGLIEPIAEYGRDLGQSIVGGYVYRGSAIPELVGRYLFADTITGRIWMLEDDGLGGFGRVDLLDTSAFISSFAQGNDGELYLLDLGGHRVHKIVAGSGGGSTDTIPALLSDTGCVDPADPTIPANGLIPYTINAPFWSDGADKERYLAIPDGTTITVDGDDDWTFPIGTVIVKNFRLAGQLIETRLLMRHPDGGWGGYTYEWDVAQAEAARVIGGKTKDIGGVLWNYPSEGQCDRCHTAIAGFALGPESAQLNRDFMYAATGRTANQLTTLDHIMLFASPLPGVPDGQPRLADPTATTATLESRARAYLHTNCSQCHRPQGPTPSNMDLRYQTPLAATNACDVVPLVGDLGVSNARLIAPGDSSRSILLNRMSRRDIHGMPPLASSLVDTAGATLLATWIDSLASCN